MYTLLTYLRRHYFFLLFVFLEVIAILLIVNHNRYQRTVFFNTSNEVTGSVNILFNNISEYFFLEENNKILAMENARLRNNLEVSMQAPFTPYYYFKDSLFRYFPAKVIYNSTRKRNNYLMLDKGEKHGVKPEMGVISSTGLVGIVIEVSWNYSTVMSLLHKNVKLSAKIKKNNQLANLIWDGKKILTGVLQDIPTHIELSVGDTVITSGYSFIFPEGIPIGTIDEYQQNPQLNLNEAVIRYTTDFNSLNYVYVVENLMKDQQINLFKETINESVDN